MRNITIAPNEYYHLCVRGNYKQVIFKDKKDYIRFLFLILHNQSPLIFSNLGRQVSHYMEDSTFNISEEIKHDIRAQRYVELVGFAFMPNHVHLIMFEKQEKGISRYMQRVLNAYTKYFNARHNTMGHLFQGPFKAIHVKDNNQLLYLSTYVHRNPRELLDWKEREHLYPWSSYQDYIGESRWGGLLSTDIILEQFNNRKEYHSFTKISPAKKEMDEVHMV